MRVVDLIEKKREGGSHSREELEAIVGGYVQGEVPDYQIAAWLMAVCWRGMQPDELANLKAHLESGRQHFAAFDVSAYCRRIETAYQEIWRRQRRGESPRMLEVAQASEQAADDKQNS